MTFQRTATFHATMTFSLSGTARYLLSKTQAVNDGNNQSNSSVQVEFYLSCWFLGLMPYVTTVICMKWKHGQAIDKDLIIRGQHGERSSFHWDSRAVDWTLFLILCSVTFVRIFPVSEKLYIPLTDFYRWKQHDASFLVLPMLSLYFIFRDLHWPTCVLQRVYKSVSFSKRVC